ncbi:hypothetical protein [Burkholderia cepacia]|uniref:hypothetical protein n=1 Tax=Burkholderia cepacia TaxID=292 RepID=UPI001146CB5C|nr:hypothetical protein [Burkholderia cepacia]
MLKVARDSLRTIEKAESLVGRERADKRAQLGAHFAWRSSAWMACFDMDLLIAHPCRLTKVKGYEK